MILSTNHILDDVPLATLLGWVTAKEVTILTENKKKGKNPSCIPQKNVRYKDTYYQKYNNVF